MGYSISVNCKSERARDKMAEFLKAHFRSWALVESGKDEPGNVSEPSEDLSYAHGKRQIGFDYNSSLWGLEREYYYTALRWIALQVGQRRHHFLADHPVTLKDAVPGTVYDGYDHWPVLLKKPIKRLLWCWFDKLGLRRAEDAISLEVGFDLFERHLLTQKEVPGKGRRKQYEYLMREDAMDLIRKWRVEAGEPYDEKEPLALKPEERTRLIVTLLSKELAEMLKPIRDEMQRLDNLWKKENHA
jgi:hypothetical protein